MHRRQDIGDAVIEALLSGKGAGDGIPPSLAAIADDLRGLASGPAPAPSPALAVLLHEGFSTENGDPSATAASNVPGPASQVAGLPKWRRRKMALAALLAGLGVAARVTFGAGVALASVTAAGAAGVLPDAVQNVVATGVEAVTPFDLPDSGDVATEPVPEPEGDPAADAVGADDTDAADAANFGERVSADARDGGVDGRVVSEEARLNGEANRAEAAEGAGRPEDPGSKGAGRAAGGAADGDDGADDATDDASATDERAAVDAAVDATVDAATDERAAVGAADGGAPAAGTSERGGGRR